MIVEHVLLSIRPGSEAAFEAGFREAREVFAEAPGCRGVRLYRGVEAPSEYRLVIEWTSIDAHVNDFRGSPGYARWRRFLDPFLASTPVPGHVVLVG